jgi:ribosomal protein S20
MQLGRVFVVAASITGLPVAAVQATNELAKAPEPARLRESADPSQWRSIALERAQTAAGAIDDPYRRAEAFASIARAQVLVEATASADRTIHQALSAAERVPEPAFRGWVLHDIVLAQIAADDLPDARQTASRIQADRPQGAALAAIADVQIRSGDLAAAQATAKRIRYAVAKSEVLRQIVGVQAARGDVEGARETLRSITDRFYQTLAHGDIAVAEVRGGNIERAYAQAARAKRASRSQVYGRIALARVDMGDAQGANETLQRMEDELHRAAIQGRIAANRAATGDARAAQESFAAAIALATSVTDQPQRKLLALAQLARLQAASGERVAARETLRQARLEAERLESGQQREETLDYIARGQARAGDATGALETAAQMNDRISRALLVRDVVTLQTDVTSAAAADSAARFEDPLIDTAAQFGVLGVQLLRTGQPISAVTIEAARDCVRKIDDMQLKPAAFSALAAARVKTGDVTASWAIFQEALAAADSIARNELRAAAYVRIVNALNDRLIFLGQPARSSVESSQEPTPLPPAVPVR